MKRSNPALVALAVLASCGSSAGSSPVALTTSTSTSVASTGRSTFCDLAVRASEGHVPLSSPGETDALLSYGGLSTAQREALRLILVDAEFRTRAGSGWDNTQLVTFVNEVCGLHLTPITMTP